MKARSKLFIDQERTTMYPESKLERYMARYHTSRDVKTSLRAIYHSLSLDCPVRKLPYCPQSHVLFVKYISTRHKQQTLTQCDHDISICDSKIQVSPRVGQTSLIPPPMKHSIHI